MPSHYSFGLRGGLSGLGGVVIGFGNGLVAADLAAEAALSAPTGPAEAVALAIHLE